jgi:hypothetical protein
MIRTSSPEGASMTATAFDFTTFAELRAVAAPYHPTNHAERSQQLDAIHAQACIAIENLVGMAERAINRGDIWAARVMLEEVRRFVDIREWIESLWVPMAVPA